MKFTFSPPEAIFLIIFKFLLTGRFFSFFSFYSLFKFRGEMTDFYSCFVSRTDLDKINKDFDFNNNFKIFLLFYKNFDF